jgi:lipoyl(octanoyl) transferase
MSKIDFEDLGIIRYKESWDYQEKLHAQAVQKKKDNQLPSNRVLFCEHPHVYTLGKSGKEQNLLIAENILKNIHAEFYKINRGGDITYHGPGQIVGYPIFDLDQFGYHVRSYIENLEEVIIRTLADFGMVAARLEGATGVWLDTETPHARKICAIGVRFSRYVTMHGFALNVNTDLKYFGYINPCGFIDKGVTSMQKELGREVSQADVKDKLKTHFMDVFAE